MKPSIIRLRALEKQLYAYLYAMTVIDFDAETVAPEGSADGRAEATEVLSRASFDLLVNDGTAALLKEAAADAETEQERALDLGIDDVPLFVGPLMLSQFDLIAAAAAVVLVTVLALLFNKTRIGVSLRAVADDTTAALSIGINLNRIWQIVWAVAGVVGLVAGLLWGARQGVQFSLSLVVLKALPVLIIGGFTSIGGAIVGGLIVGAAENLAEVYIGPLIGGGITPWFAYVLALAFLYIRPAGLFGERAIERV